MRRRRCQRALHAVAGVGGAMLGLAVLVTTAVASPSSAEHPPMALAPSPAADDISRSIVDLQPLRRTASIPIDRTEARGDVATLTNLNPAINSWYLLEFGGSGADTVAAYHLENPQPGTQVVDLNAAHPGGVELVKGGERTPCPLWSASASPLSQARGTALPYAPLCGGRLYLRNSVQGRRTTLESVADFLRRYVWHGERLIEIAKADFFKDMFIERAELQKGDSATPKPTDAPRAAAIADDQADLLVSPGQLGIQVTGHDASRLRLGSWYPAADLDGVFVSVVQPNVLSPAILASHPDRVNRLDATESTALDYLVAFDLTRYGLGFELGTDHPQLGWSSRARPDVRDERLPGPDGIATAAPLVSTGMVPPEFAAYTIATFVGGFKREHSAFKSGAMAERNRGSHYGFVVEGVVFSTLQPGLATLYVLDDGTVGLRTWDESSPKNVRFARQNGLPIIEPDPQTAFGVPGALVNRWGPGNWSGSAEKSLRTVRAGACLQDVSGRPFLLYGYFSTATPSAMARVFQGYGCRDAMQLDINALEHTYLALYVSTARGLAVEHLVTGMSVLDKTLDDRLVPRFLAYPDNRDFFFVVRRTDEER